MAPPTKKAAGETDDAGKDAATRSKTGNNSGDSASSSHRPQREKRSRRSSSSQSSDGGKQAAKVAGATAAAKPKRKPSSVASASSSQKVAFPERFHAFVSMAARRQSGVVAWSEDGTHVWLNEREHTKLAGLLLKHMGQTSIKNLKRRLYAYGWKIEDKKGMGSKAWFHPQFHRDASAAQVREIQTVLSIRNQNKENGGQDRGEEFTDDSLSQSNASNTAEDEEAAAADAGGNGGEDAEQEDGDDDGVPADIENKEQTVDVPLPDAKYEVLQTVFARDTDGVMYEAVIRRRLYGVKTQKQVQMGFVTSEQEALELLAQEEEPTWHYFVHYNNWNVNWDRWVPEDNIYPVCERVKELSQALIREHRSLRAELSGRGKGRKITVDGAEFLRRWRIKMSEVEEKLNFNDAEWGHKRRARSATSEEEEASEPGRKGRKKKGETKDAAQKKKNDTWTKANLAMEVSLRKKSLTRQSRHANRISIAFSLKKVLVEHWEIVGQCQMVLALPAEATVQEALSLYLESKGVSWNGDEDAAPEGESAAHKDWIDMAEGMCLFFDQALPTRLLYKEELPQFNVLESHPEYCRKRYCEIYGCGHLLRLFVRLPDLIADQMTDTEARTIFAKVNDFLRFLNKNQGRLFAQPYRKLNDLEKKEQSRMIKLQEKKRKATQTGGKKGDDTAQQPVAKKSRSSSEA